MLSDKELREMAEKHWDYNLLIINTLLKLAGVLYVEALMHGYKHRDEEKEVKE